MSMPITREKGDAVQDRPGLVTRFLGQRVTAFALAWIVALVLFALFAPQIAPHDPSASSVMNRFQVMSSVHWLGTDDLGRDLLSRAIWGSRIALSAVLQAVVPAFLIGVPIGLFVAYKGGWWDRIVMRLVEVEQAIPMLLFAFAFIAIFGRGLTNAMLAVGLGFAMSYLRLTRAVVLAERQKAYVQAAEVQGYPVARILFRHILPNALGPVAVQTSILAGIAILLEAMLSFLGLGVSAGTPSWGAMLDDARRFQVQQPMLSVVPGLAITFTVLSFNLLGDGLRDAFGSNSNTQAAAKLPTVTAKTSSSAAGDSVPEPSGTMLTIRDLDIEFACQDGKAQRIVRSLKLAIMQGEIYGLVGESGSGKSMTASAILAQIPPPGRIAGGSIRIDGQELVGLSEKRMRDIRGRKIGAVFQDPMMALSPVHTVGAQMIEGLVTQEGLSRAEARVRAADMLELVGIPNAKSRLDDYPHQFSGGMAQRAMIAAALIGKPDLLIADEPTTALDVTVQKQVLDLLHHLRDTLRMSILFITHDLALVTQLCDRVGVMKDGELVEEGTPQSIFARSQHPYTRQLIEARQALTVSEDNATVGG